MTALFLIIVMTVFPLAGASSVLLSYQGTGQFGYGTGPIHLSSLQCVGSETRLDDCNSGAVSGCSHTDDAGVRCLPSTGKVSTLQIHIIIMT